MVPQTLQWIGDAAGFLRLIDQTLLPNQLQFLDCRSTADTWNAISRLSVRGAPAIGIAAAYGVVIACQDSQSQSDPVIARRNALAGADYLATSRPTAVNLFWALDRMRAKISLWNPQHDTLAHFLLMEARAIHDEDRWRCRRIGQFGAPLIASCSAVLTHCNAGALATSEYGTALAVIYSAHQIDTRLRVFADETRPLLQGARLTAWELKQAGIDVTVICDSMAAHVMSCGLIQAVIVGADRIAANGDTANKIGTYALAIAARYHNIPFYVAAPLSTFDPAIADGTQIPIEFRQPDEIHTINEKRLTPPQVAAYNPAFDVTPAKLITSFITDAGVFKDCSQAAIEERIDQLSRYNSNSTG
jgi:methylthioribose-1-phosphate isomerase